MHKAIRQRTYTRHPRRTAGILHAISAGHWHCRAGRRALALSHSRHAYRAFDHTAAQMQTEQPCFFQDSLMIVLIIAGFAAVIYVVALSSGVRLVAPSELPGYPGIL